MTNVLSSIPDWIVATAAVVAAVGVIWKRALLPLVRMTRRIDTALTYVEGELRNNGGATLRDAVDRIDQRVHTIETSLQGDHQ